MSIGARRSCNKQQQLMMTWPIMMDANKAITDCDRRNQRHHRDAPTHSQDKPLKRNEEGSGNQPQATRQPCQQMQQERHEGIVSIMMILIP